MKKIYLLFLMLLIPWVNSAQISYTYDWESTGLGGWTTSGLDSFSRVTTTPCNGSGVARANNYYGAESRLISPALPGTNGVDLTVAFSYKVTDFYNNGTGATLSDFGTLTVAWSSSTSGPWTTIGTVDRNTHSVSASCAQLTFTGGGLPMSGNVFVRFVFKAGSDGDNYVYIDDVTVSQGPPPPPCTGTPNPGVVSLSSQVVCSGVIPTLISVENVNTAVSGISYQWQMSNDNGVADPWVDAVGGTGATTLRYTPPALTGTAKYYRLKTTCTATNTVVYSNVSSVFGPSSPTVGASAMTFTDVTDFSMKINWENGGGNRRMVIINEVNTFIAPNNNSGPALVASTTYTGTGQQIVYDGTGNTVTVSGLKCSATYYVRVYEYLRCGTAAPFDYWYGPALNGSRLTNSTTLSTTVENLPQTANFANFNTAGDNLSTILPGWSERSGDGTFTSNTSTWRGGVTLQSIPTARVNLYTNTRKEWMITPVVSLNAPSRIRLKAAITAYNVTTAFATGMQATDDKVQVMISTDPCGNIWTPIFTFEASNTVGLTNVLTNFNIPIPAQYVGQNVRIGFKASDGPVADSKNYDFHIADVLIGATPACADVYSVVIGTNVTKNTATISWTAAVPAPAMGYEYEIRTAGLPGTPGAEYTGTTGAGIITLNATGLIPATTYYVYVRSVCSATDKGLWSEVKSFTTLCNYPDLISTTPVTRCGIGTVDLIANYSDNELVRWYSAATGGEMLHTGTTFTTPEINTTTSYFVQAGVLTGNADVQVGDGALISSGVGQSPYYYLYGGYKTQYIYTAAELTSFGLAPGPINSVGFDVISPSIVNRNNFSIYIGTTTQSVATSTHVSGLTQVYSNAAQSMTSGINSYNFTTPFIWDGTSNIVVQVTWSNNNSGDSVNSGTVRYHTTTNPQCTYSYADSRTADQFLETMTGTVASGGGTATNSSRANTYFNGFEVCSTARIEVKATVTPAPAFTISTNQFTICANESELVTVTAGASDFNSYVWSPSEGVTGSAATGWYINATESTRFTLTASQTEGNKCAQKVFVDVKVKPIPATLPLEDAYTVCADDVIELEVSKEEFWKYEGLYGFEDPEALEFTHANGTGTTTLTSNTTYHSQGIRSVKFSHAASALGYFTLNESVSLAGSENAYVEFDHIAVLESSTTFAWDYGYLQYSVNGGTTWVNFPRSSYVGTATLNPADQAQIRFTSNSYPEWNTAFTSGTSLPNNDQWKTERFNIPANLDLSNFKIRFALQSDGSTNYEGWFIDNVRVKADIKPYILWEPNDNLFLDAAATQPYYGFDVPVVYFKSTNGMPPTTYKVSLENGLGCIVEHEMVITANKANNPLYEEQHFCGPTNVNLIVLEDIQTDGTVKWFATATSTQPITTITVTGTYYAEQDLFGCKSERTPALINIHPYLQAPTAATNQLYCGVTTVQDLQAIGVGSNTIGWFTTQDGKIPLPATTNVLTGVYYVSQNNGICWSPKVRVNITVNPIPDAPINFGTQQLCGTYTFGQIGLGQPANTVLRWYASATSTTMIPLASNIVTGTYFVVKYVAGCESARVPVQFIMGDGVNSPIAQTQNFCGSATVANLVAQGVNGAQLSWYSSSVSTTPLPSTTPLGTGTYYVSQNLNGCISSRKAVLVRIISMTPPDLTTFAICGGGTISDLHIPPVDGISYKWYISPSSLNDLPQTTVLSNGIYYVSRLSYGCETTRVPVTVSIGIVPNAPTGQANQSFTSVSTVANLVSDQPNVLWFDSYNASQSTTNNLSPSHLLVNGFTYYGVIIGPTGCPSLPFAVTVDVVLSDKEFEKSELRYHPNPVDDVLNIVYSDKITQIEVFDLLGKRVKVKNTDDNNVTIDLSDLASGTYMVQLRTESKVQFIKVIKK